MSTMRYASILAIAAALICASCASSPEAEHRRLAMEADIDDILSVELDPAEFGEIKRCLSSHDFRTFRPLGDRHILFEGRRDRLWVNTLRGRCHDLNYGDVLVVKSFGGSRLCDMDRFQVADWFGWPWYRRWPWDWGTWGTGVTCSLGKFKPITQAQVEEVEARLKSR